MKILLTTIFLILAITNAQAQHRQEEILAKDARKHIGKTLTVFDYDYRYEYRQNRANPDSALLLIRLGYLNPENEQFFIIYQKLNLKDNLQRKAAESFKNSRKAITDKTRQSSIGGYGKIFLFEGKPAMIIDKDDLMIREPVESSGWRVPAVKKRVN